MAEYGQTYDQVLKLPLRTFWAFNRQVDRLRAERDARALRIASAAQSPEGSKELAEALRAELATPVVVEKTFDEAKWDELATKFAKQRVGQVTPTQVEESE